MPIYASAKTDSTKWLHPAGSFTAVCIDVVDLGFIENRTFKKLQHKIELRFWAGEYNKENEPLIARQRFTLTLGEKANLRAFIVAWRGKQFSEAELKQFDVESLVGVNAYITVVHVDSDDGRTFANIVSAVRLPKGAETIEPLADYERAPQPEPQLTPPPAPLDPDDDDLPF